MYQRTILPEQFKKSGVHNYTISELESARQFEDYEVNRISENTVVHYDFLPKIQFRNKEVRTQLWYTEAEDDESKPLAKSLFEEIRIGDLYESQEGGKLRNQGIVVVDLIYKSAQGAQHESLNPTDLKSLMESDEGGTVTVRINIGLNKGYLCIRGGLSELEYERRLCERKLWYARELIAGYRHAACILSYAFCGQGEPRDWLASGGHVLKDLHPTQEGAYRLVCSFESVQKSLTLPEAGLDGVLSPNATVDEYLAFRDGNRAVFQSYLDYWRRTKRVDSEAVEKKTLEYFIRNSLVDGGQAPVTPSTSMQNA